MARTPFLGPAYTARSKNLADQELINLFPTIVETKTGKDVGAFYMTPGLDLLVTAGGGPIRGCYASPNLNALFVVSGNQAYKVSPSYSATLLGPIGTNSGPISIIGNQTQVAIFDGARGYLTTGSSLSSIALPFAGAPGIACYQDTFGLVSVVGTQQFYQCNSGDLSTWDALNFSSADAEEDNIVALADLHREVWITKQSNTEIWINGGLAGFAFQRLQGTLPEVGNAAAYSIARQGESLMWLARNAEGALSVVRTDGYQVKRVSTFALEYEIAKYGTVADAIGFAYTQEGHSFYQLTFPTGNATWTYDVAASDAAGVPMWHRRAALSQGVLNRHWANASAFFNGKNIVGDYRNGNLYAYNLDTATDNGTQRKWLRTWRALPKPNPKPMTFNSLQIDMETGIDVPAGTSPLCMLRWSDDGGHTWSNQMFAKAGAPGQTAKRVIFRRMGSTRRTTGLDRIFELSSADQFKVALIGAELS